LHDLFWVAWAAPAAVGVGVWLGLAWAAGRRRRRMARARRRGRRGEERAIRLLRDRGYRVIARQVTGSVEVFVDGRRGTHAVYADALVRRGWRRYIVEIKTGASASVAHRGTRRQLLEYACTFRCCGVLLVDADRGRISRIGFRVLS